MSRSDAEIWLEHKAQRSPKAQPIVNAPSSDNGPKHTEITLTVSDRLLKSLQSKTQTYYGSTRDIDQIVRKALARYEDFLSMQIRKHGSHINSELSHYMSLIAD